MNIGTADYKGQAPSFFRGDADPTAKSPSSNIWKHHIFNPEKKAEVFRHFAGGAVECFRECAGSKIVS